MNVRVSLLESVDERHMSWLQEFTEAFAATPSSSALCASIGPRTTSPIAQTFGRLVRQSSSTSTKPRSSSLRPTASRVQPGRVRHAADRDDQLVERRASAPRPWRRRSRRATSLSPSSTSLIFTPSSIFRPCFANGLLRLLRDLLVDRAEKRRQRLEHRDVGAEPAPDAAHLEADHAGADDAEPLRHLGDRERAVVVDRIALVVERRARQRARRSSRSRR